MINSLRGTNKDDKLTLGTDKDDKLTLALTSTDKHDKPTLALTSMTFSFFIYIYKMFIAETENNRINYLCRNRFIAEIENPQNRKSAQIWWRFRAVMW